MTALAAKGLRRTGGGCGRLWRSPGAGFYECPTKTFSIYNILLLQGNSFSCFYLKAAKYYRHPLDNSLGLGAGSEASVSSAECPRR